MRSIDGHTAHSRDPDDPDSHVDIVATAIQDLTGIVGVSRGLAAGRALDGPLGRPSRPPSGRTAAQLCRFGLVGAASTGAYAAIFWLLRAVAPPALANAVALVATAVANTAANRRFTFGARGRAGLASDHLGGLVALVLSLAMTNLSLAALRAAQPDPTTATELAVLAAANVAGTLTRFLLLRASILGRRHASAIQVLRGVPEGHRQRPAIGSALPGGAGAAPEPEPREDAEDCGADQRRSSCD
jgi:putative flippase GtrA